MRLRQLLLSLVERVTLTEAVSPHVLSKENLLQDLSEHSFISYFPEAPFLFGRAQVTPV